MMRAVIRGIRTAPAMGNTALLQIPSDPLPHPAPMAPPDPSRAPIREPEPDLPQIPDAPVREPEPTAPNQV